MDLVRYSSEHPLILQAVDATCDWQFWLDDLNRASSKCGSWPRVSSSVHSTRLKITSGFRCANLSSACVDLCFHHLVVPGRFIKLKVDCLMGLESQGF